MTISGKKAMSLKESREVYVEVFGRTNGRGKYVIILYSQKKKRHSEKGHIHKIYYAYPYHSSILLFIATDLPLCLIHELIFSIDIYAYKQLYCMYGFGMLYVFRNLLDVLDISLSSKKVLLYHHHDSGHCDS